ncbi:MAG TPA: thioredoxin domain-containing protein [Gemmatimonadota bacterium]|nr:thioredoxin domain-containing protein [Gemmatimonadota bacterium]
MTTGKRPRQTPPAPWGRWALILAALVVAGGLVWWMARPSSAGEDAGAAEDAAAGPGPRPLDLSSGPTVEAAAAVDAPPESLASAGSEIPGGVDISNDPRLGSATAPVTVVEFSDFQCPHCATFHDQIFPALQRLYGDQVRWVFVNRFFPQHDMAERAAMAGECAARQGKFWEFADPVFAGQSRLSRSMLDEVARDIGLDMAAYGTCMENAETASEVAADQAEGERLRIDATPTFIVNGRRLVGAQPIDTWNEVLAPYFNR